MLYFLLYFCTDCKYFVDIWKWCFAKSFMRLHNSKIICSVPTHCATFPTCCTLLSFISIKYVVNKNFFLFRVGKSGEKWNVFTWVTRDISQTKRSISMTWSVRHPEYSWVEETLSKNILLLAKIYFLFYIFLFLMSWDRFW